MAKVTKKVCHFLGADLVLMKEDDALKHQKIEQELNMLCSLLQKVIVEGTTLTLYDLGGNEIEHSRCNAND